MKKIIHLFREFEVRCIPDMSYALELDQREPEERGDWFTEHKETRKSRRKHKPQEAR